MTQQDIINDNIIKQYEIRVQQDIKINELERDVKEYKKLYEEYKTRFEFYRDCFDQEQHHSLKLNELNRQLEKDVENLANNNRKLVTKIAEREKYDQLGDEYQDLVRICTAIYKLDKHVLKAMINESLGGDNFEKFKDHLGV